MVVIGSDVDHDRVSLRGHLLHETFSVLVIGIGHAQSHPYVVVSAMTARVCEQVRRQLKKRSKAVLAQGLTSARVAVTVHDELIQRLRDVAITSC